MTKVIKKVYWCVAIMNRLGIRNREEKQAARSVLQKMMNWVYLQTARKIKAQVWTLVEPIWGFKSS
jgi:hypothetical protein